MNRMFLICRKFEPEGGSYSAVFRETAKAARAKGYYVTILSGHDEDKVKLDFLPYAAHFKFPLPKKHIPLLGQNWHYIVLSKYVKKYFKHTPLEKEDIILTNCLAGLGVLDKEFFLRMGQPAHILIKNLSMGKNQSIKTIIGRRLHYGIQGYLEARVVKKATGLIVTSMESRKHITRVFGGKEKPYFVPQSGVTI